jgi:hypothetical protein
MMRRPRRDEVERAQKYYRKSLHNLYRWPNTVFGNQVMENLLSRRCSMNAENMKCVLNMVRKSKRENLCGHVCGVTVQHGSQSNNF